MSASGDPISVHAFMFPFRWDYIFDNKPKEQIHYSKRTQLEDFHRVFSGCQPTIRRTHFIIGDSKTKFNEFSYFHSFTRNALYDLEETDEANKQLMYYELDGGENDYYQIEILNGETYTLAFKSICFHIYRTGVGVLTFNLENHTRSDKADILKINEYGRRIYPQFLSAESGVTGTKYAFLANKISGKIGNIHFEEDFSQYDTDNLHTGSVFLAPDMIKKAFGYKGQDREGSNMPFVFRKSHENIGKIRISLVTDDRMFFLCWYGNNAISNELKIQGSKIEDYAYCQHDFWYSFIFGDKGEPMIANENMKTLHLLESTYARWVGLGTLYGMSRDSFVGISEDLKTLPSYLRIPDHFMTMYYQMAVLCLVQRASVLRFQYEVSNITQLLNSNKNANPRIKDLYKNYIEFINRIYFREVTSQIQGIEMYSQFQKVMHLEKDAKDLDAEIQELHAYVSIDEQERLTKVATWFLPASVIMGILGISALGETTMEYKGHKVDYDSWKWVGLSILLSIISGIILAKILNLKINNKLWTRK